MSEGDTNMNSVFGSAAALTLLAKIIIIIIRLEEWS